MLYMKTPEITARILHQICAVRLLAAVTHAAATRALTVIMPREGSVSRIIKSKYGAIIEIFSVTVQHPIKGTLIFGQNRENKISVLSVL